MISKLAEKVLIFLDDVRNVIPRGDYRTFSVCRSYDKCIQSLNEHAAAGDDIYLDLDHDLGEDKTGYDVCKYIVENHIPITAFSIHSQNPVDVQNMRQLMIHYGYKEFHY